MISNRQGIILKSIFNEVNEVFISDLEDILKISKQKITNLMSDFSQYSSFHIDFTKEKIIIDTKTDLDQDILSTELDAFLNKKKNQYKNSPDQLVFLILVAVRVIGSLFFIFLTVINFLLALLYLASLLLIYNLNERGYILLIIILVADMLVGVFLSLSSFATYYGDFLLGALYFDMILLILTIKRLPNIV